VKDNTTRYVPPGGFGCADGTVMTKAQVTAAVTSFARRHGYYVRTVRTMTALKMAAIQEYRRGTSQV